MVFLNGREWLWALRALVLSFNAACEIYIEGRIDDELLDNLRKILVRLRTNRVTANPEKTELGLDEVEYVGHLI